MTGPGSLRATAREPSTTTTTTFRASWSSGGRHRRVGARLGRFAIERRLMPHRPRNRSALRNKNWAPSLVGARVGGSVSTLGTVTHFGRQWSAPDWRERGRPILKPQVVDDGLTFLTGAVTWQHLSLKSPTSSP